MKRALFSSFLLLFSVSASVFAQRDTLRSTFLVAESWFLFEEYSEALPLYQCLLDSDPDNDNFRYKIGICLLNDPYQKDEAIRYLLQASKNINPAYKEGSIKERMAPPDALYYLASAYLVNELLDQAEETFDKFLEVMDREVYDEDLVLAQIRSCENARRLKSVPVDIDLNLLDTLINTRYADIRPVLSGDGTRMAFVTRLPFYDAAFYTEKSGNGWSYPQLITQSLGFDRNIYPVALSYDGTEMILYYDDEYVGNLYYSRLVNGSWAPATKMGENISTRYWESTACFSKNGKSLYFTSNRRGSYGGLDIYCSERQSDGRWGVPVNLGPAINTRYNEECPSVSEDGRTLYFSSYGHYNMGGYDLFRSRKDENGTWTEPVNMGYPISTTGDDLYFQPTDHGNAAYYAVYTPRGIGRHDIYYMNIYSDRNPRLYSVTGRMHSEKGEPDRRVIFVTGTGSGDTVIRTTPGEDGGFGFQLRQGSYELHFRGEGCEELVMPLRITSATSREGIRLDEIIELHAVEEEWLASEEDKTGIETGESLPEGVDANRVIIRDTAPGGAEKAEDEQAVAGAPGRGETDRLQPGDESKRGIEETTEPQDITYSINSAGRPGWPLPLAAVIAGTGLIWFLIARWIQRKKRQKQVN